MNKQFKHSKQPNTSSRITSNKIQVFVPFSEKETAKKIQKVFSCFVVGYKNNPRYKSGVWDGKEKYYKLFTLKKENGWIFELEIGFLYKLYREKIITKTDFLEMSKIYKTDISKELILKTLKELSKTLDFKPRKYQLKMALDFLMFNRKLGIASVGSGKSLVAYYVSFANKNFNKKTLIIVPTVDLTQQLFNDFKEYSKRDTLEEIQKIGGENTGVRKLTGKIVISTWQSLKNIPKTEIQKYDCIITDETHKAKADVLQGILKTNVKHKVGMTGSFPIVKQDAMRLEQIFGEPKLYASMKDLMNLGVLTYSCVVSLFLNHPRKYTKYNFKYQQEIKYIRESVQRNVFIKNFISKTSINQNTKGITVGLYVSTKFGESLYEELTQESIKKLRNSFILQKQKNIFFISGKTKPEIREKIRKFLNSDDSKNSILIGQTNILDTGINLPKLKNIIFLEPPGKSFTKIIQSIGRVMRKHKEKGDKVFIFDIVDVFDYKKENYCLQHFWERLSYYEMEKLDILEKEIML